MRKRRDLSFSYKCDKFARIFGFVIANRIIWIQMFMKCLCHVKQNMKIRNRNHFN